MIHELRYRFALGDESRNLLTTRVEARSLMGEEREEAASSHAVLFVTRVVAVEESAASLAITSLDDPGRVHHVTMTERGEIRPLREDQRVPGVVHALPAQPVGVGSTWRAPCRPPLFSKDVVLGYVLKQILDLPSGRRAIIEWDSQALALPLEGGGRVEFHAWGSLGLDINRGRLVTARAMTRRRDVRLDRVAESITQVDLEDVTDDGLQP